MTSIRNEEKLSINTKDISIKNEPLLEDESLYYENIEKTEVINSSVASIFTNETKPNSLDFPPSYISKRQLRKQQKLQKRLEMHSDSEWKSKRKLKKKQRKLRNRMASVVIEKPKITPMSNSENRITVVIDFSYDELMSPKDLIKCGNQVIRCYSANRRSSNPIQLHFCNFNGKIKQEIGKNNGHFKWDINFHEDNYLNVFDKSKLVYLTSESKNVLEALEENKVYIIGGLVDHNAHKGVSYLKAEHEGIAHAQLPIKKYIHMTSRSVLTINHVFEILLKISNGDSWLKTLINVVPPRMFENYSGKAATMTENTSNSSDSRNAGNKKFDVSVITPDNLSTVSNEDT